MATGSLADYFVSLPPLPLHMGMLAGAGVLRADAAGYELEHLEDRHYRATAALEQALADGALGVSLGLGYAPGVLHHGGADPGLCSPSPGRMCR